jgi:hypothetical protein
MQGADKHIIQKQLLEVISNGTDNAFTFQQDLEALWKQNLTPRLEKLLDSYNTGGDTIQIGQLYIDVSVDSLADMEGTVIAEIDKQLRQRVAVSPGEPLTTVARRQIELLVFYLQKGHLPWWSPVKNRIEWQQYLTELLSKQINNSDSYNLTAAFKTAAARNRLLAELTAAQFWQLVAAIAAKSAEVLQADLSSFNKALGGSYILDDFSIAYKHAVLRSAQAEVPANDIYAAVAAHLAELISGLSQPVISAISKSAIVNIPLKQVIEKRAVNLAAGEEVFKDIKPELPVDNEGKRAEDQTAIEQKEEVNTADDTGTLEDIYIANSGLVIVAPYLAEFFKQMQLVDKGRLTASDKAVALLNYTVYGHDELAEFECVLSKILCGLEVSAVVKSYRLNDAEKQEADELLAAVIAHWQVLKNTSVQGLRASFLQREGRLSFADNEWRLKVQNQPYDVLLAHIPWNISMIKLSWMQHLLKVDWV